MNLIDRIKNILVTPKTEWDAINGEDSTPEVLMMNYVLPLATASAVGPLLSGFIFSDYLDLTYVSVTATVVFISSILSYYISIYIIDFLAINFRSEKNLNKSAQLVAYSSTPSYVAGLLSFIPVVGSFLGFAGWIYSIYILYLGLEPLKKTPEDKKAIYLTVAFIVMVAAMLVISGILRFILFTIVSLGL